MSEDKNSTSSEVLVSALEVEGLFGTLRYRIDVPRINDQTSRLMLLHGDNGSGKTTLLRLLWHALSPAMNQGHRTFLARTPFRRFNIEFTGGAAISISKVDALRGSFDYTLTRPEKPQLTVRYIADENLRVRSAQESSEDFNQLAYFAQLELEAGIEARRNVRALGRPRDRRAEAEGEYVLAEFLDSEVKNPLFLADDRILYSDDPDTNRLRDLLSKRSDYEVRDRLPRLSILELNVALRRVNDTIRNLTLGGQAQGAQNSNAIYSNLLDQFMASQYSDPGDDRDGVGALRRLENIESFGRGYEAYGLVPSFDTAAFRHKLDVLSESSLANVVENVMAPFLSTVEARYAALREAHDVLQSLVPTINGFLRRKRIQFTPRSGLEIITDDGTLLGAEDLSSGERQLMMLMCTTLLARLEARLFIIDEPELSLGIEWQRKIIDSLLGVTAGSGVQFIVATHSIEVISGNADSYVPLRAL